VALAILTTAVAGIVGRHYATDFSLPGTDTQRAADLLKGQFHAQSGDVDTLVFHVSRGTIDANASAAVADGIAFTGRVISAAAAIMVCVFLSFMLGNERTIKEFGFGLAAAVFLDALVVRCVLLPAVLELLGPATWRLPAWLDARLPHINIEGTAARSGVGASPATPTPEVSSDAQFERAR
jgi:uncharacterized membrane protein YdfJ with MMPL/SSD domain